MSDPNNKPTALTALVPLPSVAVVRASGVEELMSHIRPEWQAKSLVHRTIALLNVDPSSACQRIFNAAIHDLREKVKIAGIDIATNVAKNNSLPPLQCNEDVDRYPTAKLLDLAFRIGLLEQPDWRRLCRCYEIRRDLEHEDDQYVAGPEDCLYIFRTAIEAVLSKDPIEPVAVSDLKVLVETPGPSGPTGQLYEDFVSAPVVRQTEILKYLVAIALSNDEPEVVRRNAYACISAFAGGARNDAKIEAARLIQKKAGRKPLSESMASVALACKAFEYIREAQRVDFFERQYSQMEQVGTSWRAHAEHGGLLKSFSVFGGLTSCPAPVRAKIVKWLVLTYLGTQGGLTSYGHVREVFFSDTAAPIIEELFMSAGSVIPSELSAACQCSEVVSLCRDRHIRRRLDRLLDIVPAAGPATLP